MGLLNPLCGEKHKQVMYLNRETKHKISSKKRGSARKGRRRARRERRRKLKIRYNTTRARSRTEKLNVKTWNVHSLSLTGRLRAGYSTKKMQTIKNKCRRNVMCSVVTS